MATHIGNVIQFVKLRNDWWGSFGRFVVGTWSLSSLDKGMLSCLIKNARIFRDFISVFFSPLISMSEQQLKFRIDYPSAKYHTLPFCFQVDS